MGSHHRVKGGAIVVDEVVWVEQKVEVFHSFSQEERLHAVVKLVVPEVLDLPQDGRSRRESQSRKQFGRKSQAATFTNCSAAEGFWVNHSLQFHSF